MSGACAARPGLSIGYENVDGTRVVVLRGEIDHHHRDGPQEALLPPEGSPRTVADFGGATFMDPSGVDVLIATHQAGAGCVWWVGGSPSGASWRSSASTRSFPATPPSRMP
ncbi:STAS domain-containing protein [Streptomyces sp. NWU49]|uniref:STAS domain-containing protein n=1 Tax=Streptomyces sp. NWU49 TaxID=2201153 RepID=UPI0026D8A7D6|nr:STAS domain-containing protein [Streptomyces sp. NWU49]